MTIANGLRLSSLVRMTLVTVLFAMPAGCGGGGGPAAPAAVTPRLTPASAKLFRFSWADVAERNRIPFTGKPRRRLGLHPGRHPARQHHDLRPRRLPAEAGERALYRPGL